MQFLSTFAHPANYRQIKLRPHWDVLHITAGGFRVIVKEFNDAKLPKLAQADNVEYKSFANRLYQKCPSFGKARGKVSSEVIIDT